MSIHENISDTSSSSWTGDAENPVINEEPNPLEEVKALAEKETKRMRFWKFFVVIAILFTGGVVSTGIYVFLTEQRSEGFYNKFSLHTNTLADVWEIQTSTLMKSLEDLSEEITAFAHMSNMSFPFVTIPLFEVFAKHTRDHAGMENIMFLPLVGADDRLAWETYSVHNQDWIEKSRKIQLDCGEKPDLSQYTPGPIPPFIGEVDFRTGAFQRASDGRDVYSPVWQVSPPPATPFFTNYDVLTIPGAYTLFQAMKSKKVPVQGRVTNVQPMSIGLLTEKDHASFHSKYVRPMGNTSLFEYPHTLVLTPVFKEVDHGDKSDIVAYLTSVMPFDHYMGGLPEDISGLDVVLRNTCNQTHTYRLGGSQAEYLGDGDLHERAYDKMQERIRFSVYDVSDKGTDDQGYCNYFFDVYPSEKFEREAGGSFAILYTFLSAAVFTTIAIAFFVYDAFVQRRNSKIIDAAAKSNAIVLSLFPSNFRDRLLGKAINERLNEPLHRRSRRSLGSFVDESRADESATNNGDSQTPIAELYPSCTILFADIAGFTAWSSAREPAQVFMLLESLYQSFDEIAQRRRVYKVETIGDCYVAVAGLPQKRDDHALVMARFARDCLHKMRDIVKGLEVALGPGTGDLSLRVGLHSGPCTAGIIRSDRARFQLFGDTVNTASRMESTGRKDWVQISKDTADLLIAHGKSKWLLRRADMVAPKGKGLMQTYWLVFSDSNKGSEEFSVDREIPAETTMDPALNQSMGSLSLTSDKVSALIDWNVELLTRSIEQIVASRNFFSSRSLWTDSNHSVEGEGVTPLEEVVEVLSLTKSSVRKMKKMGNTRLSESVTKELKQFVTLVAAMHKENAFHNFSHASHVTMSVSKLLTRIISPDEKDCSLDVSLHDKSFGIISDPLAQFACIFSSLVHDIDHPGKTNACLVQEASPLAKAYKGQSVAEQNSVDIAWSLLMRDEFSDFRRCICPNEAELKRFRKLVVNLVMATDVIDHDLQAKRNKLWNRAFLGMDGSSHESERVARNRKATAVLEHMIQASDVAHTMQHWHVYRKWNELLFLEMTRAYQEDHASKNPAETWYESELAFFDYLVIPLAKKLKECGVFGASSDEYLSYAEQNRQEWELRGREIVAEMTEAMSLHVSSSKLMTVEE